MTILEFVSIIRDSLVGGAAITTAVVAVSGLNNWRRELRGRIEFETARNLIKATYQVRDKLQASRSPYVLVNEFPTDYPGDYNATVEQKLQAWSYIYNNRWAPVREALKDFDIYALEAEALWGSDIRVEADNLRHCAVKLQTAMQAFIDNKEQQGEDFRLDKEFAKEVNSDLYYIATNADNPLSNKIKNVVHAIEVVVRPHLRRM